MKDVSIVVPVYNEAERLRKNVPKIIKEIEKIDEKIVGYNNLKFDVPFISKG